MKIDEIKNIPIVELLTHLGFQPAYRTGGGRQWVYHSPFRPDGKASFSVSVPKNVWQDFGTSEGGNVIDLAIALNGHCSFHEAVLWLEDQFRDFGYNPVMDCDSFDDSYNRMMCVKVQPLENPLLLRYLGSRGIPPGIATRYCREVHYIIRDREYFAVSFQNILGGIEIRNPFFKGCYGVKGPSVLPLSKESRTGCCCVFEGFMDFLSYRTLEQSGNEVVQPFPCDCIVLNSTSMVRKTVPFADVYRRSYCYLDNDDAGRRAFGKMSEFLPGKLIDCSGTGSLALYKDLNDYLMSVKGAGV